MTFRDAQRTAMACGYALSRTGYGTEFRLAPKLSDRQQAEAEAYYTDDLDDALGTLAALRPWAA